ncbi:hypothetical protein VST7929_02414 [Vibrio stylophorae]|uniref:MSHA biogenesis protein MshI n=1 Tax=Vibrio stylophorae TaxID=659351 RepID=A0ABM8ZVX0_9VIBR|nr:hypothetical protein [Vibrio stylophorae]CAH0534481.1 hypothetical protein VST7929_02414 [Vibrio stylophorae]
MGLRSLFTSANHQELQLGVALFKDSMHFVLCRQQQLVSVQTCTVDGVKQWATVLQQQIAKMNASGAAVHLVVSDDVTKSLQVEPPAVAPADRAQALPFLVKELVSQPPQNIVVDGVETAKGDRLQCYVVQKAQILALAEACDAADAELISVQAEEMIWAQVMPQTPSQMLLCSHGDGNPLLLAFQQQHPCLQRELRGFHAPFAQDDLQLDGLALELQRSLDYLSSQLRKTPLNQVFVCCDSDDDQILANAITERLNIKAQPLPVADAQLTVSGQYLAYAVAQAAAAGQPFSHNLYPAYLKPKKIRLTLPRTFALSGAVFAVLLGYGLWSQWQLQQIEDQTDQLTQSLAQSKQLVAQKKAQLDSLQPNLGLLESLALKQQRVENLQQLMVLVASHDIHLNAGYAGVMMDLAKAARNDIALSHIRVFGKHVELQGQTTSVSAVPNWVQSFESFQALSGRDFGHFDLSRDEQGRLNFSLLAQPKQAQAEVRR